MHSGKKLLWESLISVEPQWWDVLRYYKRLKTLGFTEEETEELWEDTDEGDFEKRIKGFRA